MIREPDDLGHNIVGRFVLLLHHEDGVRNRTKTSVCGRIGNDRLLIHLRDEWKENLLFFLDMRIHFVAKRFNKFGDPCQLGSRSLRFADNLWPFQRSLGSS